MVNVLAGLIGAMLGFAGAVLGAGIKNRGEQSKWPRDQKLAGAAEMVSAGTNIYELRKGSADRLASFEPSELREWQSQLQKGRSVIHLLCNQQTRDRADSFAKSCWRGKPSSDPDGIIEAVRSFSTSLREELGSKPR